MAIKFEDDKGGMAKLEIAAPKPTPTLRSPENEFGEVQAPLPFAKAVRPEKKRKGR